MAAACTALLPAAAAVAAPFFVTSTSNSGPDSLRAAIVSANDNPGADTIPISVAGTIELTEALPTIEEDVWIGGAAPGIQEVRRNAAGGFRIFTFSPDVTSAAISGLTISGGLEEWGGGIFNDSGSLTLTRVVVRGNEAVASDDADTLARGGGIYSFGPLTVRESVVSENVARASNGGNTVGANGGGILAEGSITIDRSTISGNLASAELGGSAAAEGGGLQVGGPMTIELSTISGNTVSASGGGLLTTVRGGGIKATGDDASLTGSTIAGNSAIASSSGSAKVATGANLDLQETHLVRNTIVADPRGSATSCGVPLTSGGFNLDEDSSCEFGQGSDLAAVDPLLGPLAQNGGPTPTHALALGSVALDRGNAFGSTTDQRGLPRPVNFATVSDSEGGDGSDIGAFELQATPLSPTAAPVLVRAVPRDTRPPNTRIVSGPARVTFKRLAKFRFASTEGQSRFQCKVDKRRWKGCASPFQRTVSAAAKRGRKHLFKVRAIDRFGNVDPTPARFGWRVKKIVG